MRSALAALRLPVVLDVAPEGARRRELAELVADHRLGDEHRDVGLAVVHRERVAEHGRHDHGAAGPGLDDVLGAGFVLGVHLLDQVVVDEGSLLQATRHLNPSLALLVRLAAADDVLVRRLLGRTSTAFLLAPRGHRVATTGGPALTTTVRVVNRVHHDTTDGRANVAPPPGRSSIAWIVVPTGMLRMARLLPGLMSAPGPFSTRSPCCRLR